MANKKKKQQAVDFAHQMARQRQSYIDTEYGATAYGGSQYSATKAQKQQANKDYAAWKERNAKRGTGSQTTSTGRATQPKQSDGLEVLRQAQAAMSGGAKQQTAPGQLPTIDPTHIMTPAERTELLLQTEERKQEQNKKQTKAARKALGDDEIATYIQNRDAAAREMKDLSLGDVLSNPLYAAGVALENLDYGVSDVARTLFNSKKQAEINRRVAEYNAAAPATPGGASAGQMIADIVNRGAANWTSGTAQTINTFAGAPLRAAGWKDNPLQHFEEATKANQDANQARYDMDFAEANGVQRKVGDIGTSTVEALPDMVLLAMTGPGKALAQGETALTRDGARLVGSEAARAGASAAAGAAATARQVAKNSLKNPMFWTSFSRVAGPSYNYAKQQGATDWEASVYATSNAVMNAQVEMSGGLQTLPWELQQGGRVALTYLKSMAQEGNEEVVQGMIERTLQNLAYGADNPVFSTSDPNAVINPRTAASEFGMGAAVSAVLGAPSSVAQGVENMSTREARAQEAEAAQRAARVADADAARARQNEAFGAPMQSGTADAEALAVLNRNAARRGEGGAQTAGAVQSTQQSTLSDPIARLIAGEAVGNKSLNQIRTNPEARARLENALGVQIPNSLTPSQFRAFVRYVAQYGAESNLSDESTTEGNLTAEPQTAPTQSETGQNVYDWTNRANGGSELGTASVYLMSRSIGGATDPAQMERFMLREGIPAESLQEAVDNGYIEFNGKQYVLTKRGEELITQMTREGVFSTQVDAPRKPSPAQPKTDAPGGDIGEEARTFSPEDHIDNRTDAYISKTSTKAFQHEHPELHNHFANIAQRIMEEAAISIDRGVTKVSKKNGGGTRAYYDKGLKAVIDRTGLSRNQVIRVCQDIINDQGSENYADAKRVEQALDDLMSGGGEYADADYKQKKGEITGGTQAGSFEEYLQENELALAEGMTVEQLREEWENGGAVPGLITEETPAAPAGAVAEAAQEVLENDANSLPEGQGAASAGFDTTPENADYNAWSENAGEVHPLGEKAVRDPQLPTVNPQGERTMRGGRTVMEAQSTTEERAQQIANQYVNGEMAYIPVKNKDLAAQAEASIEKEGWERSLRDWTARVRRGEVSKELMAMGATLINNAGNSGMDARSYLDLASDYVTLTHKAGQALQATRVLKNLSPSARLYMMQRSIYSIAEEMGMESGEIREDLVQRYNDAQTDAERDAVIDEIKDDIASRMKPSLLDKWNALRYTNMLGNFKTQDRNIIGNTTMGLEAAIRRRVDALIGGAAQAVSGGKVQRDVSAFYRPSLGTAAFEDFKNIERYAKGESKYSDAGGTLQKNEFLRDVNDRRRIFKNPILEGYRKLTKLAMEKGDDVFIRLTYADAMAQYLNAHGVTDGDALRSGAVDTEILDAAREYAVREAQEATFHDNNRFSSWVSQIGRGENTPKLVKVAIEGTMPFRKTPANIAVRGYEYSPLGVASALINTVQAANENSDVSANDAIRSWSKTVTGSAVLLAGFTLARMGILRGKDDDDDKKAAFDHLTGHQEYSIEIGGKSYTIDAFAPTCMPLLVGAEAARLTMENGWDVKNIEAALANLVDPMINMSMLQGVNDTLDNIKTADNSIIQLAELSALNYLTQGMTNTMLGQAERTFEPNRMTTYVDDESPLPSWMQRQIGKMSAKVPGWDYHQTEYIDSWGRKQSNGTLAERAFSNFLAPWYSSDVGSDSVETELERLYGKSKDSGLLPTAYAPSELKFDGEQRKATQGEKARYQTVYGQTAHSGLDELFKSSAYLSMTDEEKALAVSNLYEYSNDEGKRAAGADHETPDWAERGDASVVQNAGFYSILEAAKKQLDKDDREKTGPQMQAILDRGLSEEDTLGVFRHILTGSSESTMEKIENAPDPLYWARNYVNLQTSRDTLPEDMKSKNGPQMQAVLDSGASAEDALAQFRMITGDESKTVDKMRTLYDDDYPLDMIVGYYTAANEEGQFWSSYKNGYTKKRNQAAMIQYMMENYGLTRVQAKHMYDVFNGKA